MVQVYSAPKASDSKTTNAMFEQESVAAEKYAAAILAGSCSPQTQPSQSIRLYKNHGIVGKK